MRISKLFYTLACCALAVTLTIAGGAAVTSPLASFDHPGPVIEGPPDAPWIVFTERAEARESTIESSRLVELLDKGATFTGEMVTDAETDIDWIHTMNFKREAFIVRSTAHRVHPDNVVDGDIPIGQEKVDRWWGLPLEYEASDLVPVPDEWNGDGDGVYRLRKEACDALVRMLSAAQAEGIEIRVISAYRSGQTQTRIFTRNISRNPAQRSSAPPGHSEHQLGTCVDLTDAALQHNFSGTFDEQPEGMWLEANGPRFGFHRSYRPENVGQSGYISEPWHWRYWGMSEEVVPVAGGD